MNKTETADPGGAPVQTAHSPPAALSCLFVAPPALAPPNLACRVPPEGVPSSGTPWILLRMTDSASSEGPWLDQWCVGPEHRLQCV